MSNEILQFANTDLQIARAEGEAIVTRAKQGVLLVKYNEETRLYSIRHWNTGEVYLTGVKKGQALAFLTDSYDLQQVESKAATKAEEGPAKSAGHIGFAHGMEYYWRNGELYRAPINNPVFPDGFRCGRWHSNAHAATYFLQQVGLA